MTLHVGSSGSSVSRLQADLKRLGVFHHSVTGYFGNVTKGAVKAWEAKHHLHVDGFVDSKEAATIHHAAAAQHAPAAHPAAHPAGGAPPNNYHHVGFRQVTVNVRTRAMFLQAEKYFHQMGGHGNWGLGQGSYSHSSKSAGTHAGGGALDVRVGGHSMHQRKLMVKALRMAGFAAWNRGPDHGFDPHIHAIAIGDRTLSGPARSQVRAYFHGRDGLAGNGRDGDASVGRPYPAWAARYK